MAESAQRVPEDSVAYREFARLYAVARQLRPSPVDRWNGELYATSDVGGFDQQTGAIGMREPLLREGLTKDPAGNARWQARALATVLNRASRAGMHLDAPGAPNAVRTIQSRGLNDGVASVLAAADFHAFTRVAGYPNLAFNDQESGAFAAVDELIRQTSGPIVDRFGLADRLHQGPATMHFDQLAEAVVQNRLQEVAPAEGPDRQALRRELIGTMLHPRWDSLSQATPADGRRVAAEIGQALNAKVDEIRQGPHHPTAETTADGTTKGGMPATTATQDGTREHEAAPTTDAAKAHDIATARFLTGMAPAGGAVTSTPQLGQGSRRPTHTSTPSQQRGRTPE